MVELYWQCQSDNGSLTASHGLRQWSDKYIQSLQSLKDPRAPMQLQGLLSAAGFVDVEVKMIPLPTCAWSNGSYPLFSPSSHRYGYPKRREGHDRPLIIV